MQDRPPSRKIGVVGVRDFKGSLYENTTYIVRTLEEYLRQNRLSPEMVHIVTGGGKGVERMVVEWCKAKGVSHRTIPPNIEAHGPKKAFIVRNNHVVSDSDDLVVFWDGCIDITSEAITTAMHQQKKAAVYPLI